MEKVTPHRVMWAHPRYELLKVTRVHMTLKPLILRQLKKNPKTQREDPLRRTTDGMFLLPLGDGSKTQHMVWTHLQRASPSSSVTRG